MKRIMIEKNNPDYIASLMDEELGALYRKYYKDRIELLRKEADTKRCEEEICYIQREIEQRRIRIQKHIEYKKQFEIWDEIFN